MGDKIRLETDPLTPELVEKAAKELRETPEVVNESLEELRRLLKNEKDLFFKDTDDILIRYLRPTKFYPQSALALMRKEAEFKEKHKEILANLMPQQLEDIILHEDVINIFVDRDQHGRRIMLHKAGKAWNPKIVSSEQVFQMFYLVHQGAVLEPATQVNGVVVILDFNGLGLTQARAFSPTFALRLLTFIQDAMPLRLKEVHIVNQPWLFDMVWKLFQPFVKEKLSKRLHFHGSKLDGLHQFIPKAYLPKDYGGDLPKMEYKAKDWYPVLRSIDDKIKENNSFGLVKKS